MQIQKHTVDERVQDRHGVLGDTSVRVNLLEDYLHKVRSRCFEVRKKCSRLTLVDVRAVGLVARVGALLLATRGSSLLAGILLLGSLGGSGGSLRGGLLVSSLGSHFE